MDHWGDPWADTDDKSPTTTKQELASPPPPVTRAPIVLNGFLDDAGWGNNEGDGFGAWASAPRKPELADEELETRVNGVKSTTTWDDILDTRQDGFDPEDKAEMLPESNAWSRFEQDAEEPRETDNVVSETSDSATTIQADDVPERIATDFADSLHADDDLSTRPSTSPSDVSHNEAATESPRTSFEDERAARKTPVIEQDLSDTLEKDVASSSGEIEKQPETTASEGADDEFGDFEEDEIQEAAEAQLKAEPVKQPMVSPGWGVTEHKTSFNEAREPASPRPVEPSVGKLGLDTTLLAQLFPPAKDTPQLDEALDDPVYSSSTRKAWYRLTRKQTMREFNSGGDDDNYIRVTWKTSQIRSDVNKIVARWASEDRIAGRGPGARASFYWDSAPASEPKAPFQPRQKSLVSVSNPVRSARQSVPPLSTDVPAAFNWSSPATANGSLQQDAPGTRSVSSPITAKHNAVTKLQRQEGRSVSVDLTPRPKEPAAHKRTATSANLLNDDAPPASFSSTVPLEASASEVTDPWANLGALDTSPPPMQGTTAADDDDDDWGEMVESPAVSTVQTPIAEISEPSTRNNTISTPSTTPKSVKSSPLQTLPPSGSKHASPIVRLKGTVSPTSALFKPNAFVPASVEEGPIGPRLLRPRNKSAESTPEKKKASPEPIAQLDEVLQAEAAEPELAEPEPTSTVADDVDVDDDDFSAFETSTPLPDLPASATPPPPASPWADEPDFSIFESSLPTSAVPPTQPPVTSPSDPWSIFETAAPESTPPPAPFARPPPRPATPPTKQPLTGATNSAQRRKIEEDEIIRSIIEGLPDLSYMLRR